MENIIGKKKLSSGIKERPLRLAASPRQPVSSLGDCLFNSKPSAFGWTLQELFQDSLSAVVSSSVV